jgi:hypothetical protein
MGLLNKFLNLIDASPNDHDYIIRDIIDLIKKDIAIVGRKNFSLHGEKGNYRGFSIGICFDNSREIELDEIPKGLSTSFVSFSLIAIDSRDKQYTHNKIRMYNRKTDKFTELEVSYALKREMLKLAIKLDDIFRKDIF